MKAILLGLLGAALICGATFFNDMVIHSTYLVGNYVPISVYGGLILFLLFVNPILFWIRKKWVLSGRELGFIVALALVACYVPGRGLMHYLTTFMMLPHHHARMKPSWQATTTRPGILEHVPKQMLADISKDETKVLDGFVTGLGKADEWISPREIPWHAWRRTMIFWLPLIICISIGFIGLSLVLHRQWSDHEHLPYPIVEFASSLLPAKGEIRGSVFRNRLFWIALSAVLIIHLNNYACGWWPDKSIKIPTSFSFKSLLGIFPTMLRGGSWGIFRLTIYFTVVGFAYFLATDVSLSLGIAPYLFVYVSGILAGYGVTFGGAHVSLNVQNFLYGGGYFGMFLVLLYTGRHYYISVLKRGLFLSARDEPEPHAIWGMRVFIVASILFIIQLSIVGLDWYVAVLYTAATVMTFVVISRLVSEAGVFFLHSTFYPGILLLGFFGSVAIGPTNMLIMGMVSSILLIDPREAVMPFMVTGLKLVDRTGGRIMRAAKWGVVALLVSLAVAVPVTLYLQYKHGAVAAGDGWTCNAVPIFTFQENVRIRQKLEAQGLIDTVESLSLWQRIRAVSPGPPYIIAFCTTLFLVLLFTVCRLRFAWWPLHPLMFCVLGTWQSRALASSFFIGWLIKVIVTRYGGSAAYRKLKPFMIGLIAGEALAGLLILMIGAIYYFVKGQPGIWFRILPS